MRRPIGFVSQFSLWIRIGFQGSSETHAWLLSSNSRVFDLVSAGEWNPRTRAGFVIGFVFHIRASIGGLSYRAEWRGSSRGKGAKQIARESARPGQYRGGPPGRTG